MEVTRIFDLLTHYKLSYKEKDDVLAGKEGGNWVKYGLAQYQDYANQISYGLLKLGIGKGDTIATISNNRPEWNFIDMGIMQIGAVHVPIYPTISEEDYKYILKHAGVKIVFVAGKELLRKIEHILPEIENVQKVYTFKEVEAYENLSGLVELGKQNPVPDVVEKIKAEIVENDVATLIYTSGTTGFPKGVMLSHKNFLWMKIPGG